MGRVRGVGLALTGGPIDLFNQFCCLFGICCVIFLPHVVRGGGAGGSPLDPLLPLPWTPCPALPPHSSSVVENLGFGNFLWWQEKNFWRLWHMPYTVYLLFYVHSMFRASQITMTQHSLSAYFGSPVQPPPHLKPLFYLSTCLS